MAPFVPLLDPSAPTLVPALSLIAPLLVPASILRAVLPTLPSSASYYVLLEDADVESALDILDGGASKIIVPPTALAQLSGVDASRLVVRSDEPVAGASGIYTSQNVQPPTQGVEVFYAPSDLSPESVASVSKSTTHTLVLPTAALTTSLSLSLIDVTTLYTPQLVSDRPDRLRLPRPFS